MAVTDYVAWVLGVVGIMVSMCGLIGALVVALGILGEERD